MLLSGRFHLAMMLVLTIVLAVERGGFSDPSGLQSLSNERH
jgi:hypothetical protein